MKNGIRSFIQLMLLLIGLWMGVTGVWMLRDNLTTLFPGLTKLPGYDADDSVYYCVVSFVGAEKIGENWENTQAEDGYSFYKLQYTVTNMGDRYYYSDCPAMYYTADHYDDVLDAWEWYKGETDESSSPFAYYEQSCIPVGRTTVAYDIVQVRNGLTEFEASYYPNYEDDTQESFLQITLQ